jgi:uncharacterized protein (TIGR02300 family)
VAKAQLGTKRTCPSCAARFYDLAKSPAECPKCEHSFDPEVLLKPRRTRPEPVRVVKEKEEEPEEAEADEEEEEVEVEADVVAPVEAALDTEEEDTPPETGAPARKRETPLEEDGLVEVVEEGEEDEEVEIVEIEEEDGDVSGILDADLDKEEP